MLALGTLLGTPTLGWQQVLRWSGGALPLSLGS